MRIKSALVALVLVLAACGGSADPTLEALVEPGGETTGFGSFTAGMVKSFGVFVCSNDGVATLTSIEPMIVEGEIDFLGAMVYKSSDKFVGAANGYPTDGLDESHLEPMEGAAVEADCGDSDGDRVQLIIGAERTGSGGGVLDGFLVTYDGGELEIPFTILLCGDGMEYCEALIPDQGGTSTTAPSDS